MKKNRLTVHLTWEDDSVVGNVYELAGNVELGRGSRLGGEMPAVLAYIAKLGEAVEAVSCSGLPVEQGRIFSDWARQYSTAA